VPEFLADESLDYRIVKFLRNNKFKVTAVCENYSGIPDEEVLRLAERNNLLLLTEDSDFGRWVFSHGFKNVGIIFLRYEKNTLQEVKNALLATINRYGEILYGKFVTLTPYKVRIRSL